MIKFAKYALTVLMAIVPVSALAQTSDVVEVKKDVVSEAMTHKEFSDIWLDQTTGQNQLRFDGKLLRIESFVYNTSYSKQDQFFPEIPAKVSISATYKASGDKVAYGVYCQIVMPSSNGEYALGLKKGDPIVMTGKLNIGPLAANLYLKDCTVE